MSERPNWSAEISPCESWELESPHSVVCAVRPRCKPGDIFYDPINVTKQHFIPSWCYVWQRTLFIWNARHLEAIGLRARLWHTWKVWWWRQKRKSSWLSGCLATCGSGWGGSSLPLSPFSPSLSVSSTSPPSSLPRPWPRVSVRRLQSAPLQQQQRRQPTKKMAPLYEAEMRLCPRALRRPRVKRRELRDGEKNKPAACPLRCYRWSGGHFVTASGWCCGACVRARVCVLNYRQVASV